MKNRLKIAGLLAAAIAVLAVLGQVLPPHTAGATALSADRSTNYYEGGQFYYPVYQSTTIYQGALVCINSSGYAIPCTDTANLIVVGVSLEQVDNSSGSDGDETIEVRAGTIEKFNATSITQAMVGQAMYVKDDNTFDDTSTNLVFAGVLVDYDSATVGWIRLPNPEGELAASNVILIDSAGNLSAVNVEAGIAEIFSDLAGNTTGMGASLVGIEDSAANFAATDVEAALAEIIADYAATTNGNGASKIGVEDSGALTANADVEAVLAEILTHIQTAQAFIPIGLTGLREASGNDIPAIDAGDTINDPPGGILAKDTTPILEYANGDTDSALRINWAGGNSDPVVFQTALPPDLDTAADVVLHLRAAMAGTDDSPVLATDCYFNEGDTKVEDGVTITGASYAEYTVTIAAADVPAGAQTMTCELTPGTHATDAQYVTALWIEYTRSTLTQ